MVKVINDAFMVCGDCLVIIANDDASGLDYYLDEDAAAEREAEIRQAITGIQSDGSYIAAGNGDQDDEFSSLPCACCKTNLAGTRHHCVVLDQ